MNKEEIFGRLSSISVLIDVAIEHGFLDGEISENIRDSVSKLKDILENDIKNSYG